MLQLPTADAANPFAALSLIAAPAILTNACSLLVMSTSNRLARAVDLGRELARELERTAASRDDAEAALRLRELAAANVRSILLVRALRAVYAAMGGFATATFISLVGVVFVDQFAAPVRGLVELLALGAGLLGVGGILWAAALLTRDTRIAVAVLSERVAVQQARFGSAARP